jgi:hypothetical protein
MDVDFELFGEVTDAETIAIGSLDSRFAVPSETQ